MGLFNYFCRKEDKIKKEKTSMSKNVIVAEGYADDLYEISNNGEMKQTRLFYIIPDNLEENQETLDLVITSTNPYHSFPIFDNLLGKKIRISVDIIEE